MVTTGTDPRPAGRPLLDQVLALLVDGTLTVSGPADGATVEVQGADNGVSARFPLVAGAASSVVPQAAEVRILDATGAVVAEAPVIEIKDGRQRRLSHCVGIKALADMSEVGSPACGCDV